MKKKTTKKLVLAKETLRSLLAVDLREAAGGTAFSCGACGTNTCHLCFPSDADVC